MSVCDRAWAAAGRPSVLAAVTGAGTRNAPIPIAKRFLTCDSGAGEGARGGAKRALSDAIGPDVGAYAICHRDD
jgi:hypothetical protein